jgi:hypothetical protein
MVNPIPSPDAIPVGWWWFQVLLLFTFLVHVILMNFMLGGSLLAVLGILRNRNTGQESLTIPVLVALTINFGIPPLLFVQVLYGHLFYSSSIVMAVPWILVIPILIMAYYGAHVFAHRLAGNPVLAKTTLAVSALLLLAIAFVFVNNNTLVLTPARWGSYFRHPGGMALNIGERTLFPRYLHFLVGAVAVAGLGKATWFRFSKNMDEDRQKEGIHDGLRTFGIMTIAQIAIGIWFWLSLPEHIWKLFMGGNIAYTVLMLAGWLLALLVLHSSFSNRYWVALATGLSTLAIMVVVRDLVRQAYLDKVFHPKDLLVTGESSPLVAFLGIFIVGLFFLGYMIRIAVKPETEKP